MKTFLLAFGLLLVAANISFAGGKNPNLRICWQLAEEHDSAYLQLNVSRSEFLDTLPFCKLGNALMGTPSLMAWVWDQAETQALLAYKNVNASLQDCESVGAVGLQATNADNGEELTVCEFADQSWIEFSTLQKGPQHSDNATLSKVFGL